MAISFALSSSSQYLVVVRHNDGSEAPFKVFCSTVAEVRRHVTRSLRGMQVIAGAAGRQVYVSRKANDINASAVKHLAHCGRRYLVATGAGMELDVVLLR